MFNELKDLKNNLTEAENSLQKAQTHRDEADAQLKGRQKEAQELLGVSSRQLLKLPKLKISKEAREILTLMLTTLGFSIGVSFVAFGLVRPSILAGICGLAIAGVSIFYYVRILK